jgi:fructose-1,6-bisphosphatase/inositol monophosphatase family enzyme
MGTPLWEKELAVAQAIAKEAGIIMLRYFDGGQQAIRKEDGTPLTIADTAINRLVIERLQEAFPEDGVIGEEESTCEYGMGRVWLCDPIDGTKAYTWGVPTAMFSLGLVQDGVPVVGVTYDPFLDRIYTAAKGQGAFCNDEPLQVSSKGFADGVVAISSNLEKLRSDSAFFDSLVAARIRTASFSGCVYKCALIAKGRMVAYTEDMVNAYDMAASQVIIEEAGGKITALDGSPLDYAKPFRGAAVSNGTAHDELVRHIQLDRK